MKTLIIVSHPTVLESGSQQFLIQSLPDDEDITLHLLEETYPNGNIDVEKEQALLREHDRVLFQFPFYWYSSPPLLKKWQDEVLTEHFAFGYRGNRLQNKEFGLVLAIGLPEKEYQTGGREGFSISELTKPYQAMAKKTGMTYLKPLTIFQFSYMTEKQKKALLIDYQQYISLEQPISLKRREEWFIKQLTKTSKETLPGEHATFVIEEAIDKIEDNRLELDELRLHLDNYDDK
ncbi:MAG: NAD(P)H-dependent oxidoreductase [Alkalibacterium sp.]|uniref:Putative NADPH-quinone reductase (Modulator of drug activity B) n=1 Tax=Alkalibacterium gilvum TaxID=1130080 RepID=A0A1H6VW49_9LACT|nr:MULTISPECIES: NAD(P)H-dependent oxidoreductase [Alkalibacterium]MDN6195269.1 NAD(P)H-dependent oxidoreductase [Atopostipes suicloacalis]MDN6294075.1 NAD(P)H-dependent oxidoreductase [Alkalibacterium sp.]MDN6295683.1 NAD(P)H-dependent oxidoreductase [Alkalibacterium sp.]MDN6326984.1 NAD(P)H-dependent oxidoreductase [Alkalibacterium sp.]MDN6385532.1 NAD(P)H-dependent oxidoreductase [Alkalibacterium sp.]